MEHLNPTREQMDELLASLPMDKPVTMLNLLRFNDQANYRETDNQPPCSGKEAYGRYGTVVREKLAQLGAEIIWSGKPQGTLIGPMDEQWDEAFLVRYPTAEALFEMLSMPDYQAATVHRTAALLDSRLIPNHDVR
jgi:uncharacterized protein (DUF1330 family)